MTSESAPNPTESSAPLHGVLVHAASEPGKLARIDTAAARATGAIVLTGQLLLDLDPYLGPVVRDLPLLAIDRIRYTGEPVAVVAAETLEQAQAAAALETIEVTPLPAAVTGAPNGQPTLVHLTEMLRSGPLAGDLEIHRERSNRLIWYATAHDGLSREPNPLGERAELRTMDPPPAELLAASASMSGSTVILSGAGIDAHGVNAQIAQLFDPVGLTIERTPGLAASPIAPSIDALAIALARSTKRPVQLHAATADFGWSAPRGHLEVLDTSAMLTIDAGASAGPLPLWIDLFRQWIESRFALTTVTIAVDYSEAPPLAASLDDWRDALAPA